MPSPKHPACIYAVLSEKDSINPCSPLSKSYILFKVRPNYLLFPEASQGCCKEPDMPLRLCSHGACLCSLVALSHQLELAVGESAWPHSCDLCELSACPVTDTSTCDIISKHSEQKPWVACRGTVLSPPHPPCSVCLGGEFRITSEVISR